MENYAFSRTKAKTASDKGKEPLYDAISFKPALTNTGSGTGGSRLNTTALIIVGAIVVIIGIAGYFLLKSKNRREEY